MDEKLSYKDLINGEIPPWVMRFIKETGKGINEFSMIKDGDTVLISASGGKDSLALSLALSIRRKWLPIDYKLKALMINWIEHPIEEEYKQKLKEYYNALDIDFIIFDEHQFPSSFKGEFNCYLCSRNRRRILFDYAFKNDIKLIAMGHHLDDLVETSLMNLCFRAKQDTMKPVQEFFDGKLYVVDIRCPHLGCQLEWNPDERSWDCPCHGSRFDYHGKLISNPAQEDIYLE